jgi:U3 small nucleolar RNA-associated protein 23
MRHLYASASEPGISYVIDKAKLFERRRCDHHPEEYPEPLSALECISSVVDPKGSKTNKHRYVVASQDLDVRKVMRSVMGATSIAVS